MIVLGIDPGLDGAIAIIDTIDGVATVMDTPTLTIENKGKKRREYNAHEMASILSRYVHYVRAEAVIELVHAMPKQGVRSMWTMGFGSGVWEGLLAGLSISYRRVTPQRWKKALMDGMGKDKDASRAVAMRLFPELADRLARKKDDGRADALLIAEYGRRTL